jgi:hypothetical protein
MSAVRLSHHLGASNVASAEGKPQAPFARLPNRKDRFDGIGLSLAPPTLGGYQAASRFYNSIREYLSISVQTLKRALLAESEKGRIAE